MAAAVAPAVRCGSSWRSRRVLPVPAARAQPVARRNCWPGPHRGNHPVRAGPGSAPRGSSRRTRAATAGAARPPSLPLRCGRPVGLLRSSPSRTKKTSSSTSCRRRGAVAALGPLVQEHEGAGRVCGAGPDAHQGSQEPHGPLLPGGQGLRAGARCTAFVPSPHNHRRHAPHRSSPALPHRGIISGPHRGAAPSPMCSAGRRTRRG